MVIARTVASAGANIGVAVSVLRGIGGEASLAATLMGSAVAHRSRQRKSHDLARRRGRTRLLGRCEAANTFAVDQQLLGDFTLRQIRPSVGTNCRSMPASRSPAII